MKKGNRLVLSNRIFYNLASTFFLVFKWNVHYDYDEL